jgi:hypothetical protein
MREGLSNWLGLAQIAVWVAFFICLLWEWDKSAAFAGVFGERRYTPDGLLLFAFVWGKTLWLLAPALAIAGLLIALGFRRSGHAAVFLGLLAIVAFSLVNAFTLAFYGSHIHDMLDVAKGGVNDVWRFIRDLSWETGAIACAGAAVVVLVGVVFGRAAKTTAAWTARSASAAGFRWLAAVSLVPALLAGASVPLTLALRQDELGPRLLLLLPVSSFLEGWFPAGPIVNAADPEVRAARAVAAARVADAWNHRGIDPQAFVRVADPPDILFIIVECFRAGDFSAGAMPRLRALAERGLLLENHYSGANMTHMGLFTLLYGRSHVVRSALRTRDFTPQLCESLRRSGYRLTFLLSDPGWARQGLLPMINEKYFDRIVAGEAVGFEESDRRLAAEAARVLSVPDAAPQAVFLFLASTSPPFYYPQRLEVHKPVSDPDGLLNVFRLPVEGLRNRYKNALLYIEELIVDLVASQGPDLDRTLVVVTGDHGESLGEDGWMWHGGAMAEAQFRVPCFLVGRGITPRKVLGKTVHYDILPTLLHALNGAPVPLAGGHGLDVFQGVPDARAIDVTPRRVFGMQTVIVSCASKRVLFKIGRLDDPEVHPPEPLALLDAGGRIVLSSPR